MFHKFQKWGVMFGAWLIIFLILPVPVVITWTYPTGQTATTLTWSPVFATTTDNAINFANPFDDVTHTTWGVDTNPLWYMTDALLSLLLVAYVVTLHKRAHHG